MLELVDGGRSKRPAEKRVGSSPTTGTNPPSPFSGAGGLYLWDENPRFDLVGLAAQRLRAT